MSRPPKASELDFEIEFCESILRQGSEYPEVMEMLAGYYTRAGRVDDGLALDQKLVALEPDNATAVYNLACSLALKDRKIEAVERLREAISKGYDDFKWLMKDGDLRSLHAFPPFQALLAEFQIPQQ
ncbi:MAG: TPR end-of-group domain-containing protein [Opitutales bacterium]